MNWKCPENIGLDHMGCDPANLSPVLTESPAPPLNDFKNGMSG